MRQNYSPRLEMQIPQEHTYTGLEIINKNDKLEEFLKNNYKFSSDNISEIKEYISEDPELEKIIYDLPDIVSKEFPECPITLDFMDYTLPDEIILQISIKTPYDGETTSNKKDIIDDEFINNYNNCKYYFINMEF